MSITTHGWGSGLISTQGWGGFGLPIPFPPADLVPRIIGDLDLTPDLEASLSMRPTVSISFLRPLADAEDVGERPSVSVVPLKPKILKD